MTQSTLESLLDPTLLSFVNASRATHPQVYDIDDGKLSWPYIYKNRELMEDRLLNGGFHLAAILNDIYK